MNIRAASQSRFKVAGEISRISAVSSAENPPKNRRSTCLACLADNSSNAFNARSMLGKSNSGVTAICTGSEFAGSRLAALLARARSTRIFRMMIAVAVKKGARSANDIPSAAASRSHASCSNSVGDNVAFGAWPRNRADAIRRNSGYTLSITCDSASRSPFLQCRNSSVIPADSDPVAMHTV